MTPMRRKIVKIYALALAVGLGYLLWLRLTGLGIPCLMNLTTGLLCPGCGATRMCLELLRLDVAAAFRHNGAVLCLFFYWNLVALLCFVGRPRFVQRPGFLYGSLWTSIAVLVGYGILRNVL